MKVRHPGKRRGIPFLPRRATIPEPGPPRPRARAVDVLKFAKPKPGKFRTCSSSATRKRSRTAWPSGCARVVIWVRCRSRFLWSGSSAKPNPGTMWPISPCETSFVPYSQRETAPAGGRSLPIVRKGTHDGKIRRATDLSNAPPFSGSGRRSRLKEGESHSPETFFDTRPGSGQRRATRERGDNLTYNSLDRSRRAQIR